MADAMDLVRPDKCALRRTERRGRLTTLAHGVVNFGIVPLCSTRFFPISHGGIHGVAEVEKVQEAVKTEADKVAVSAQKLAEDVKKEAAAAQKKAQAPPAKPAAPKAPAGAKKYGWS
jgi:hypothetical protein